MNPTSAPEITTGLAFLGPRDGLKGLYRCSCGCEKWINHSNVKYGKVHSCGCSSRENTETKQIINRVGARFGKLTVLELVGRNPVKWLCACDCGTNCTVAASHLVSGHTRSCGCLSASAARSRSTTHGMSKTPIYRRWRGMLNRCYRPTHDAYKWYGARGITVDPRWLTFENFLSDMGQPRPGQTIDRIDPNGPYSRENCEWVTHQENCKRRSANGRH